MEKRTENRAQMKVQNIEMIYSEDKILLES